MNWYAIGTIVVAVILGLFIVYANKSEQEYDQGYNDAEDNYRQQMQNAMWQQYLNQMQGGGDDEEDDEEENDE